MNASTRKFHETLIRLFKGMITAWEEWLKLQPLASQRSQPSEAGKKS